MKTAVIGFLGSQLDAHGFAVIECMFDAGEMAELSAALDLGRCACYPDRTGVV